MIHQKKNTYNYLFVVYPIFQTITIDDPILGLGVVQDDECGRNEACARHSEFRLGFKWDARAILW